MNLRPCCASCKVKRAKLPATLYNMKFHYSEVPPQINLASLAKATWQKSLTNYIYFFYLDPTINLISVINTTQTDMYPQNVQFYGLSNNRLRSLLSLAGGGSAQALCWTQFTV